VKVNTKKNEKSNISPTPETPKKGRRRSLSVKATTAEIKKGRSRSKNTKEA